MPTQRHRGLCFPWREAVLLAVVRVRRRPSLQVGFLWCVHAYKVDSLDVEVPNAASCVSPLLGTTTRPMHGQGGKRCNGSLCSLLQQTTC